MDVVVKIAKSLGSMNLGVLIGIGVFFVFLILLILKGSILQTGLRIFNKKKYSFYFMIIPTFLAILVNMILLFMAYLVVVTKFDINIVEVAVQFLFNALTDFKPILYIILAVIIAEVIFLIIQAFILKLVTFDIYKSIKNLIHKIANKISKKGKSESETQDNNTNETYELAKNAPEANVTNAKPKFANGLLAGLFCFSIMVFLTIILLYIGERIGISLNL